MTLNLTKPLALLTFAAAILVGLSGCEVMDDTGTWRGTAVNRDDFREPYTCNMETKLTHTDDEVILHHIVADCGAYRGVWHPGKFEVHGTTVWKNGRAVGWAKDDGSVTLDINDPAGMFDERYPYPASRVVISWVRVNGRLEYTEEAHFAGRVQRTHGWLSRDYL
jgi:hypothetical protein